MTEQHPTTPFRRLEAWASDHARGLTLANVGTQIGIIVTGGAVRLTASGLGCSTWPQCEPGQFTPEFHEALSGHTLIEFGNRMLTFVLLVVAGLVLLSLWNSRKDLRLLASVPILGVIAQGVIGGITVLTELHPLIVGIHLLVSAVLVWWSVFLALRVRNAPALDRGGVNLHRYIGVLSLSSVVILGVLTTGAGPHSGDAEKTERLALDPASIARVHAMSVWAYLIIMVLLVWRLRRAASTGGSPDFTRSWRVLGAVVLLQAGIGYAQYFTGLPIVLVGMHLLGAGLMVAAHSAFHYFSRPQEFTSKGA